MPAGVYLTGPLRFGENAIGRESVAPAGFIGVGRRSILQAINKDMECVLIARNCSSRIFNNFAITQQVPQWGLILHGWFMMVLR